MKSNISSLAEKAGFMIWGDEPWGPGPDHIDWAAIYDDEMVKFSKEILLDFYRNHFNLNGEDITAQIEKYLE